MKDGYRGDRRALPQLIRGLVALTNYHIDQHPLSEGDELYDPLRFSVPRHQAKKILIRPMIHQKAMRSRILQRLLHHQQHHCDESNPNPEKSEKQGFRMTLNISSLNTDDQMLFPNFPFVAHNRAVLVCCFAENKLNVGTKKHSFIIDEALIDAEDRQDDGGYYQRSSFRTTLATSSSSLHECDVLRIRT